MGLINAMRNIVVNFEGSTELVTNHKGYVGFDDVKLRYIAFGRFTVFFNNLGINLALGNNVVKVVSLIY